jgi:hypothetical protein
MFDATKINTEMTHSKLLQGLQKWNKKPLIHRNVTNNNTKAKKGPRRKTQSKIHFEKEQTNRIFRLTL